MRPRCSSIASKRSCPENKRRMLEQLHNTDAVFAGKRVLIVDDDVRNIFSLTSVLESHGMNVAFAENGRDALAMLESGRRCGSRADGRDDAGDGRVRDDTSDPSESAIPLTADHRADRKGDEGRPREVHCGRRIGLHHEAGRHRAAAVAHARVVVPMSRDGVDRSPSRRRDATGRRREDRSRRRPRVSRPTVGPTRPPAVVRSRARASRDRAAARRRSTATTASTFDRTRTRRFADDCGVASRPKG